MHFWTAILLLILILTPSSSRAENLEEVRATFQRGYQLFENGDFYSSIHHLKVVLQSQSYPLQDYAYYFIAKNYKNSKNFTEAFQVYEIVLNYFKDSVLVPQTYLEIAQCQKELEKFEEAVKTLKKVIADYPKHELIPQARYELGINLEKLGNYTEAAKVYQNLDLLHPDSDWAEKAIQRLDILAKRSPLPLYEAPAATIYNLGIKYFTKSNYYKAKEYFTRLTKFYKKSSFYDEAILMLGRFYLRKGNFSQAVSWFKKCITQDKDSKPEAMYYLALTFGYQGETQSATATLKKVVEEFPQHYSADDALYYLGEYSGDLSFYEKLIKFYPYSNLAAEALWKVGKTYHAQENYEDAYKSFSRAINLPPQQSEDRLIFWAGKSAEKIGKKDEAISAYKTTIDLYDHSYYAYRAREELAKYNILIPAEPVPAVSDINPIININSHGEKYEELLALGLEEEAAREAEFVIEKAPLSKKDEAKIALYHAHITQAKFSKPIQFADKKIEEAALSKSKVDPRLWRFSYPRGYWQHVEKYAKKYKLDPYLVYAVIREESRFDHRALSRSWAHGLMQVIPSTGRKLSQLLGIRYSRWKLYDPRVNIWMGTYYLAWLIREFDGNIFLALAGYNGGPNRVSKWLNKYPENFDIDEFVENIPKKETRNYVKKVIKSYYGYKRTYERG